MNETNIVKMTMYGGLKVLLDKNADEYKTKKGFKDQTDNFETLYDLLLIKGGEAGVVKRGVTTLKDEAKAEMAELGSMFCGFAYTKLDELGMHDVTEQLMVNPTDFISLTDSEAGVKGQAMYQLMSDNQLKITDDYLTVLQLASFQASITNFNTTKGASTSGHTAGPVATKVFNDSFVLVDAAITSILRMGKIFKTTAPDFYNNLIAATTLPAAHVLHTNVGITVVAKATQKPISTAKGAIDKLNKSGIANEAGVINLNRVRNGQQAITVIAPGFKPLSFNGAIQRGRQNDFNVEMESE